METPPTHTRAVMIGEVLKSSLSGARCLGQDRTRKALETWKCSAWVSHRDHIIRGDKDEDLQHYLS